MTRKIENKSNNTNTTEILETRLNKIKMDFGLDEKIDVLTFLEEVAYTLNNSNTTEGYMTTGEKITTDYGYVCDLFSEIEEVLLKRIRK